MHKQQASVSASLVSENCHFTNFFERPSIIYNWQDKTKVFAADKRNVYLTTEWTYIQLCGNKNQAHDKAKLKNTWFQTWKQFTFN